MAMTASVSVDQVEDGAETLAAAACLFRSLGDSTRLAILRHLALGEHRVRDLTDHLGLAQSTVSAHLACLRDCGLVVSRQQGRASMFSLTQQPALLDLLAAAERLLALTGDAVVLCPTNGLAASAAAPAAVDPARNPPRVPTAAVPDAPIVRSAPGTRSTSR